jgi:hypothetical protein
LKRYQVCNEKKGWKKTDTMNGEKDKKRKKKEEESDGG